MIQEFEQIGRLALEDDIARLQPAGIKTERLPVYCEGPRQTQFGIVSITGGAPEGITLADADGLSPKGFYPWLKEPEPEERKSQASLFARDKLFCYTLVPGRRQPMVAERFEIIDRPGGILGELVAVPLLEDPEGIGNGWGEAVRKGLADGTLQIGPFRTPPDMVAYFGEGGLCVAGPLSFSPDGVLAPSEAVEIPVDSCLGQLIVRPGALFVDEPLYSRLRIQMCSPEGAGESGQVAADMDEDSLKEDFRQWCLRAGLHYRPETLAEFHNAMKNERGCLLRSGAGSGKTSLCRAYARALGAGFFTLTAPVSAASLDAVMEIPVEEEIPVQGAEDVRTLEDLAETLEARPDALAVLEVAGLGAGQDAGVWIQALDRLAGRAPNLLTVISSVPEDEKEALPSRLCDRFAVIGVPASWQTGADKRSAPSGQVWGSAAYGTLKSAGPCPPAMENLLKALSLRHHGKAPLVSRRGAARAGALTAGLIPEFSRGDACDLVLCEIVIPGIAGMQEEASESIRELRAALAGSSAGDFRRSLDALADKEKELEWYGYIR